MTYIRSSSGPVNANPEILTASAAEIANVKINSNIKTGTIAAAGTSKFKWDPTSTAPASDTVIVPNDGTNPGRWLIETISASDLPKADSETAGIIALSGDITGIFDSIKVSQVNNQRVPWKNSVRFALTSNVAVLSSFTVAQPEGTAIANDRLLLTGQTAGAENGIYVVGSVSGGLAALTRASDMASSADCVVGSKIHVSEGTLFANTEWVLGTQGVVTLGTTALQFTPERVPTVAALRLVSGASDKQTLSLTSYSVLNDGGGGEFYWDSASTAADDGGTVIAPTGVATGRWKRQFSGSFHAEWFGLNVTNNAAANTAAMVAAVTAAKTLPNGGEVIVPQGKFAVIVPSAHGSSAFHLVGVSNVTIRGAGRYITTFYDSGSRATDAEIYPTNTGDPGGTSAFFTFEGATNVWFHEIGFQGAGTYVQGDLGRDAVDKKAIYWKSGSLGTTNCGAPDCYFTLIEGESIYADGSTAHPVNGLNCDRCHFKQILSNAFNPGVGPANAGFHISANDCIVEDCGGSPAQFGGTGTSFCRANISNPAGLFQGSTQIIAVNASDCKIDDCNFDSLKMIAGAEYISIGFFFDSGTSGTSVRRNKFRNCGVLGDAGNRACLISISASTTGIACLDTVVEDNWAINCFDTVNGSFPNSRFIRVMGTEHITGRIHRNHIDNGTVAHGLKSAVYINAGVDVSNGLIIGEHTYDSSVTSAFVFNVAPALAGRVIPTAASTNVIDTTHAGSPEGAVTGDTGSLCRDTTNGDLYVKNTGTGNTGWSVMARGAGSGFVPTSRSLTGSGAIKIAGDNAAHDLSADRTISIADAAAGVKGAIQIGTDLGGTAAAPTVISLTGTTGTVSMKGTSIVWTTTGLGPTVQEGGPFGNGLVLKAKGTEVISLYNDGYNIGYWTWANGNTIYRVAPGATNYSVLADQGTSQSIRIKVAGTTPDGIYLDANGAGSINIASNPTDKLGFYGHGASSQLTVTGSRGGNAALTNLLAQLASLGLIIDSSSS